MKKYILLAISIVAHVGTLSAQVHVGPGQTYPTLYAVSRDHAAKPGDTIYLHAGTYSDIQGPIDSIMGTSDNWIWIRPYANDSVSIHVQYTFQHAQYLRISGLNFYGADPAMSANVYHQLYFDYAYDCFRAIHDIIVEDCSFTDLLNSGKENSGASLKFTGTENFVVRNCLFRNAINAADGISFNGDRNGIVEACTFEELQGNGSHCKGGSKNITYRRNRFIDCVSCGLDVGGDTGPQFFCPLAAGWEADSIHVYSNIFVGGLTGIKLSDCHNSEIYQNTCFKTIQFAFRSLNASANNIVLENNRIYNNIFTTASPFGIYMNASSNFNYSSEYFQSNLFHNYFQPDPTTINWSEMPGVNVSNSIIGDPLFTDTTHGDFSLRPRSPAIGQGLSGLPAATDYFGHPFFIPAPSLGAIEFASAGIRDAARSTMAVYPNPFDQTIAIRTDRAVLQAQLVDPLGRTLELMASARGNGFVDLNTKWASRGEYFLVLRMADGEIRRSLVLKE